MSVLNNIQGVKNCRVLLFVVSCLIFSNRALGKTSIRNNPKIFLYASELPRTIVEQKSILRKHVIDIILMTQVYNIMFSHIPKRLVKSKVPQRVLKYKIRTDLSNRFTLEFFLIDADRVFLVRQSKFLKISHKNLLKNFRKHLFDFLNNKKMTTDELLIFDKNSVKKISKLGNIKQRNSRNEMTKAQGLEERNIRLNQKKGNLEKSSDKSIQRNDKVKSKNKKQSLWELLIDLDRDKTWLKVILPSKKNNEIQKDNIVSKKKKNLQAPAINPFLNIGNISLKREGDFSQSLSTSQFHFALKFVQRELAINDLIKLTNEFKSLAGLTFEWIVYKPVAVSRVFLRTGLEIDKAIKTAPVKMNDHLLFRIGAGYRLPGRLLPSLYYERSNLVYANLNQIGEGIVSNIKTVNWLSFDMAYLGIKDYMSIHIAKSFYTSGVKAGREIDLPQGYRYGANYRYFFNNKFVKVKWWGDVEYRSSKFQGKNISNTIEIYKKEYSFRIGIYF